MSPRRESIVAKTPRREQIKGERENRRARNPVSPRWSPKARYRTAQDEPARHRKRREFLRSHRRIVQSDTLIGTRRATPCLANAPRRVYNQNAVTSVPRPSPSPRKPNARDSPPDRRGLPRHNPIGIRRVHTTNDQNDRQSAQKMNAGNRARVLRRTLNTRRKSPPAKCKRSTLTEAVQSHKETVHGFRRRRETDAPSHYKRRQHRHIPVRRATRCPDTTASHMTNPELRRTITPNTIAKIRTPEAVSATCSASISPVKRIGGSGIPSGDRSNK